MEIKIRSSSNVYPNFYNKPCLEICYTPEIAHDIWIYQNLSFDRDLFCLNRSVIFNKNYPDLMFESMTVLDRDCDLGKMNSKYVLPGDAEKAIEWIEPETLNTYMILVHLDFPIFKKEMKSPVGLNIRIKTHHDPLLIAKYKMEHLLSEKFDNQYMI